MAADATEADDGWKVTEPPAFPRAHALVASANTRTAVAASLPVPRIPGAWMAGEPAASKQLTPMITIRYRSVS
jgi:hypothetical protein